MFPLLSFFYHIKATEGAKYVTVLHCKTGQKYGGGVEDKMAALNDLNFGFIPFFKLDFSTL